MTRGSSPKWNIMLMRQIEADLAFTYFRMWHHLPANSATKDGKMGIMFPGNDIWE